MNTKELLSNIIIPEWIDQIIFYKIDTQINHDYSINLNCALALPNLDNAFKDFYHLIENNKVLQLSDWDEIDGLYKFSFNFYHLDLLNYKNFIDKIIDKDFIIYNLHMYLNTWTPLAKRQFLLLILKYCI